MTLTIAVAIATILTLGLAVLLLVRRLGADQQVLPVTTAWLSELSTDRYIPMLRLLEDRDFQFLRSQKGFSPRIARRLRRQRVQVLQGYLHMLEADFARASAALRLILTHSQWDRPELASLLLRRRLEFVFALSAVHCRIYLFRWGLSGVDVSSLIRLYDGVRLDLRMLMPDSAPAAI